MTAYQQGYRDAIRRDPVAPHVQNRCTHPEDYLAGYRQGVHENALESDAQRLRANKNETPPTIQIVLTLDADGYRAHAEEQEGDVGDVARYIKADALTAVSRMHLTDLAEAVLNGDACTVSQPLRDPYADQPPNTVRFTVQVIGA